MHRVYTCTVRTYELVSLGGQTHCTVGLYISLEPPPQKKTLRKHPCVVYVCLVLLLQGWAVRLRRGQRHLWISAKIHLLYSCTYHCTTAQLQPSVNRPQMFNQSARHWLEPGQTLNYLWTMKWQNVCLTPVGKKSNNYCPSVYFVRPFTCVYHRLSKAWCAVAKALSNYLLLFSFFSTIMVLAEEKWWRRGGKITSCLFLLWFLLICFPCNAL